MHEWLFYCTKISSLLRVANYVHSTTKPIHHTVHLQANLLRFSFSGFPNSVSFYICFGYFLTLFFFCLPPPPPPFCLPLVLLSPFLAFVQNTSNQVRVLCPPIPSYSIHFIFTVCWFLRSSIFNPAKCLHTPNLFAHFERLRYICGHSIHLNKINKIITNEFYPVTKSISGEFFFATGDTLLIV